VTAVGLERRTTNEPERLPSDRPEPCGPSGLGHACCSRAWLRPAPCHLPRSRAGPVKDWLVASNYPTIPRERCASPTSATDSTIRAPCGLLDSRPCPSCNLTPRDATCARAPTHPGPTATRRRGWGLASAYQMSQPGGASLDGEPPASASAAIRPAGPEVGASSAHVIQTPRGPGGASIDRSSAQCLPVAAFSTADRACVIASDVPLTTLRGPGLATGSPSHRAAGSTHAAASSKTTTSLDQDAFHQRALPPLRAPG
jgi:hypothetical protein